ncbi:MAG: glycosyltransferase family 4 protein, partial [Actinomycetota bacterium]
CLPGGGSEGGAGWFWVRLLARLGHVWIITLPNCAQDIGDVLESIPERDRLHVEAVPVPGQRRITENVWRKQNYLLWQFAALRKARKLQREVQFDAVWHVTYANVWIGSVGALVGPPFVYGPVGGGASMDWQYWRILGVRGLLTEALRDVALLTARFLNPLARASWRRARLILAQNPETRAWLPRRHQAKTRVFPNVVVQEPLAPNPRGSKDGSRVAIFVGRLEALKGPTLAVRAIAALPDWRLLICGSGPEERRVRRLVRKLGIDGRVELLGWRPREEVLRLLRRADVLLFPSFHDQAPLAVAEAISTGLPVICFDRGGAAGIAGPAGIVVRGDLIEGLVAALRDPRLRGKRRVATERARGFLLDPRSSELRNILIEVGWLSESVTPANPP